MTFRSEIGWLDLDQRLGVMRKQVSETEGGGTQLRSPLQEGTAEM